MHALIIGGALWRCHAQETQKILTTFKGGAAVHFSEEPKKDFEAGVIGWYWGEGVGLF